MFPTRWGVSSVKSLNTIKLNSNTRSYQHVQARSTMRTNNVPRANIVPTAKVIIRLTLKIVQSRSSEHSFCYFRQLRNSLLTIHEYTHLPSPDAVSDRVCCWLDRVFYMKIWAVSILPITNPQICSLAIARHCLWQGLPFARSSILSATLGSLVTSESLFIHTLTCHRPTLSPTVFAVGSIGHSLCKFSLLAYLRLTIHKYSHVPSPDTVSDRFVPFARSSIPYGNLGS